MTNKSSKTSRAVRSVWQTETDHWEGNRWRIRFSEKVSSELKNATVRKWWKVVAVCSKLNQHVQMKAVERGWIIWTREEFCLMKLVPKMRWSIQRDLWVTEWWSYRYCGWVEVIMRIMWILYSIHSEMKPTEETSEWEWFVGI